MENDEFEKMMSGYISVAKSIIQLAVGSLILPIIFLRDILGIQEGFPLKPHLNFWFYLSWGMILVSIAFGLLYQSHACQRIERKFGDILKESKLPNWLFIIMFTSFFIGIAAFVVGFTYS
ncbi:MAG: hypothetical protein HQ541_00325 [Mariniphaga sp.]|nr:hypothetical protein [Mariniphaga sp.]